MSRPTRSEQELKPAALDHPIARAAGALSTILDIWDSLAPKVKTFVDAFEPEVAEKESNTDRALKLTTLLERLTRASSNLVKATDEAARLREFLTGGPDSRPDLTNASDGELVEALIQAALARGLTKEIVKRAKAAGYDV